MGNDPELGDPFFEIIGNWRNFLKVIEKAQEFCKTANNPILDHFVDTNKSIHVPEGGEWEIEKLFLIGNRQ